MKKTRVLMCCSDLSVKGGMVSVVKNYLAYENWEDYEIVYVPTHIEKNKFFLMAFFAFSYIKIICLALFGRIDIAHLHTAERGSFFRKAILVRTLHKFGVKTIMHHHAAEFEEFYNNLNDKRKKYVCETLELADMNIVLSQSLISMIRDKAPMAKIQVLYNAVDTYESNPYNENAVNCMFLGRLGERKGTYDLLEVIQQLDHQLPDDIQFFLCGDGEIEEVRRKIEHLGIAHRICHVGWIDGEQKSRFFKNTAINILPSYHEGLPMTILETMAYGIPNVATNIASVPEVIRDGENGFLVEPGDINALADCIKKLCLEQELRREMSKKAYQLISDQFALKTHVAGLISLYNDLLS